jgi:hypothetical protein
MNMVYSQSKHIAVYNALIYKIVMLNRILFVIWKPPFCLHGMRSDKFYVMTFC